MFKSRRITTSGTGFQDRSSCRFDRSSDQLSFTETTYDVHGAGSNKKYSFSFWFKREAYDQWDRIMASTDASVSNNYRFILLGNEAASNQITLECNNDGNFIQTSGHEGLLHKWYHIVITTDGSGDGQFYENGKALTTVKDGSDDGLDAGVTFDAIGWLHNGWINDLAIYNTDVGAAGAKELYNHAQPFNHKEGRYSSNLINWWRMGDGDGDNLTTIKDQAGSLNATVTDDAHITGDVPW